MVTILNLKTPPILRDELRAIGDLTDNYIAEVRREIGNVSWERMACELEEKPDSGEEGPEVSLAIAREIRRRLAA
ncbi:hypothetical protein sos41_14000 [Alphaproteobacteria bacterium SO-S41]|nr:hypothetical protein sos41_14000 [Alphaproteobacteria bacterium SO-S41]